MDPQLKEQVVSNLHVRSFKDVQQQIADVIDLRINDGHHNVQLSKMLNRMTNINRTLHGETRQKARLWTPRGSCTIKAEFVSTSTILRRIV